MLSLSKASILSAAILTFSSSLMAGTWCQIDEVTRVDTAGNGDGDCYLTGNMDIGGTLTKIEDLHICRNADEQANARNLSLALTAFTSNKKVALWFTDYNSCSEVKTRFDAKATRISIRN